MTRPWLVGAAVLAGCGGHTAPPEPDGGGDPTSPTIVYLQPVEHLSRASLALRGVRPSLDELHEVAADPTRLSAIVDRYLDTPEFAETIKDLHNETLLMRVEQPLLSLPPKGALTATTFNDVNTVFDEPL